MRLLLAVAAVAALAGPINAHHPGSRRTHLPSLPKRIIGGAPPENHDADAADPIKAATFQQLIDHKNPSLGTFSQRYWYSAEYYRGPGSPIVLIGPNEDAGDDYVGYLTNGTIYGQFAQTNHGAAIFLEHRYYGESSPYSLLTTETLQYLTMDQTIQDLIYFAKNVQLPFDPTGSSKPDKAPWILGGCSYSGSMAAYTHHFAPGTFWAYQCSSAPVETISDFWQAYGPIDEGLPRNCSADIKSINRHFQKVLTTGTRHERIELKASFGFPTNLTDDDFLSGINAVWNKWQDQQFFSGYANMYPVCDGIEGVFNVSNDAGQHPPPGPNGVGFPQNVKNFAKLWKDYLIPEFYIYVCDDGTLNCFSTYNPNDDFYRNETIRNPYDRQWYWLRCNEAFESWELGSVHSTVGWPAAGVYNVTYFRRMCSMMFPELHGHKVGVAKGVTAEKLSRRTGGWNMVNTTRLMWINGEFDIWRSASVASKYRPGGPFLGDNDRPSWIIPKASHCNDMLMQSAEVNEGARKVMEAEISKMKEWVDDFYKRKGR